MNMEQKSLGKLISFYISASTVIYSFYYKIDVDKYVRYFVVIVAFLLMLNFKNFQKIFINTLSNFKNIIKGLIIFGFIILSIYIFFPQSRIFQTHTSGRLIHWEIIYLSFDFNNIFTGMGAGSSFEFLRNFGISLNRNLFIIGICSLTAVYLHQLIK